MPNMPKAAKSMNRSMMPIAISCQMNAARAQFCFEMEAEPPKAVIRL